MMKTMTKKMNNKKGFTLIELIVVIAILGILAALAIPRLTGTQDAARTKTHVANIKTLTSAANISVAENGAPGSEVIWNNAATSPSLGTDPHLWAKYVDTWPESPWTGTKAVTYEVKIDEEGKVTVTPAADVND